jgi:hypothetical protein
MPVSSVEGTFTPYAQPATGGSAGFSKSEAEEARAVGESNGHTSLEAMKVEGVTAAKLQEEHSKQPSARKAEPGKGNAVDQMG